MWVPKRVIGISPHADDLELGAGGTVCKWASEGVEVIHIIFSTLKQREIRTPEIYAANEKLGLDKSQIAIYDFENRRFDVRRQQILQLFSDAVKMFGADAVLVPSSFDVHQDHQIVHNEAIRAFKNTTILGYEDPWNMYKSDLRLTVGLEPKYIRAKCRAMEAHKNQAHRPYMDKTFVVGMAMMRGKMIGQQLAENFEVVRWIL
jgi:LmbE family N-acetylglucosaminyl deacetylase